MKLDFMETMLKDIDLNIGIGLQSKKELEERNYENSKNK